MAKLNIAQKTTTNLPLRPVKDGKEGFLFDGFVPSILTSVTIGEQEYSKGEFEGRKIKTLMFTYTNYKLNPDEPERYLIHTEKIIGTKEEKDGVLKDRTEEAIDKNITEMWKRVKHIMEELKYSPNYKDVSHIPQKDWNKYFDIPAIGDVEVRVKTYEGFFQYVADFINGTDGKSMLTHKRVTNGVPCWLNIQASYPDKQFWSLPTFVSQGFMEAMRFTEKGAIIPPVRLERKPSDVLVLRVKAQKGVTDNSIPGSGNEASDIVSKLALD